MPCDKVFSRNLLVNITKYYIYYVVFHERFITIAFISFFVLFLGLETLVG